MIKCSSAVANWAVSDANRPGYNVINNALFPDLADSEYTAGNYQIDLTANGFKIRGTTVSHNSSAAIYIYAAFGDPFSLARAR